MGITVAEANKRRAEAERKYGKKAVSESRRIQLWESMGLTNKEAQAAVELDSATFDYLALGRADENTEARILSAAQALGLSEVEAKHFAESINRR